MAISDGRHRLSGHSLKDESEEPGGPEDLHGQVQYMSDLCSEISVLLSLMERSADLERVNLSQIVKAVWKQQDITDSAHLDVQPGLEILGDREWLRHMFVVLFEDAVERGGPSVEVEVDVEDGTLSIADDGLGTSPAVRNDMFEPGIAGREQQSGPRLSIVQHVVDAHGWEYHVSESNTGARVDISLGV